MTDRDRLIAYILSLRRKLRYAGRLLRGWSQQIDEAHARLAAVTRERDEYKRRAEILAAFMGGDEPQLPWPKSVWPMDTEQYVLSVLDPNVRTAISGFLMREGWQLAIEAVREQLRNALAEAEMGDGDA